MKKLGINNPENPSGKEIQKLLGMMAKNANESDAQFFKSYFASMPQVASAVIDGLKSLADANVSKEYINSINEVIKTLSEDYERAESKEERAEIYDKITLLLDRIQEESNNHRQFKKQLGLYASGTAILIAGVAIAVKRPEVGRQLLSKGIGMIKG